MDINNNKNDSDKTNDNGTSPKPQSNNNNNTNPPSGYYGQMSGDSSGGNPSGSPSGSHFSSSQKPPKYPKKPQKTGIRVFVGLILAVVAVCGIVIAIAFFDEDNGGGNTQTTNQGDTPSIDIKPTPSPSKDDGAAPTGVLTSVQVAKKVSESVIAVLAYQDNRLAGEGSGVIMTEDKGSTYVITCAHIINTAGTSVRIQTSNGTKHDAEIVGYDNKTDVGVLRIAKTGFKVAEFGDSSKLQVAEPVYAIGNPGGTAFYGSFTAGVVSAIDRVTAAGESGYSMPCIQHDAAINPGNSGGALVNSYGQVIGINSSKIADTEYEGMGFAIPISVAKDIVDKIIANGYVPNRPKLGISFSEVSSSQTYSMIVQIKGLPNGSVVIAAIDENSSLNGTDAQVGDLITAVNGKKLSTSGVLLDEIENSKVGDTITLSLCRVHKDYSLKEFDIKINLIEDKGSK
ncbi:MAG: trypsin-like peptidase domain-containing protein [Oscillospiraceae bacterium]